MVGPEEWVWLLWLGQHQQPVINLVMCLLLVQGPRESDDVCFSFSQHPNIQDMVETWLVLTMICTIVIFSFVVNCGSYTRTLFCFLGCYNISISILIFVLFVCLCVNHHFCHYVSSFTFYDFQSVCQLQIEIAALTQPPAGPRISGA